MPPQGTASISSSPDGLHDELVCKIAVIGDTRVGKTTIVRALTKSLWGGDGHSMEDEDPYSPREGDAHEIASNQLSSSPKRTIGVDFFSRVMSDVRPFMDMRMQLWDTAGDPVFAPDMEAVLRHAALVVAVFDTTQEGSFRALIDNYIPLVQALRPQLPQECILVVENKIDVRHRIEAEKMRTSPAMRKLQNAAMIRGKRNESEAAGQQPADATDNTLVDLRSAQAELFELVPSVSYVDMSVHDPEKVQFLLSGIVDLLLNQWEDKLGGGGIARNPQQKTTHVEDVAIELPRATGGSALGDRGDGSSDTSSSHSGTDEPPHDLEISVHPQAGLHRASTGDAQPEEDSENSSDSSTSDEERHQRRKTKKTTKGKDGRKQREKGDGCGCGANGCCSVM